MISAVRTLLANLEPGGNAPGECVIPPGFRPRVPSAGEERIRKVLFGRSPDRSMVNYRCWQLLRILHSSPWAHYVTDLDPRVAFNHKHWPSGNAPVDVAELVPTSASSWVRGSPNAPDAEGILRDNYLFSVASGLATITRLTTGGTRTKAVVYSGGISNPIDVGETGYAVFFPASYDSGTEFAVETFRKPQKSFGTLLATVDNLGSGNLAEIFDHSTGEPWATFQRLYFNNKEVIPRLCALTLALAYHANEDL